MHETSSSALLVHFHSAPFALYNAPFDLGFKRAARLDVPDGKVLDTMVDFSDAMWVMGLRRWRPTHAAGLTRHRWSLDGPRASLANAQATAAVQRWLETPGCQEEARAAVEDIARPRGRDRINPKARGLNNSHFFTLVCRGAIPIGSSLSCRFCPPCRRIPPRVLA